MAEMNMETLLHPPFENDPPVKLNIPAKYVGLIYAILAALGLLFGIFGLLLSGIAAAFGALSGNVLAFLFPIATIIGLIADALIAWGGYQMYQEQPDSKKLVIYGLALQVVTAVVSDLGNLVHPLTLIIGVFGIIVTLIVVGIAWYIVVISRFSNEPPLVATAGGAMPPPPSAPPPSEPPAAPTYEPPAAPMYEPPAEPPAPPAPPEP